MKISILIIAGFFLLLKGYAQETNWPLVDSNFEKELSEKEVIGKPYPLFKLSNENKQLSAQGLLGKTIYINFWFKECAPCMAEMPQINKLYEKFKEDTNFVMISITFDDMEKVNAVRAAHKIEYDIFQVSRPETRRLNPTHSYPASIVVDQKGIVRFYDTGGMAMGWLTTRHFSRKIYPAIENSLKAR